jgi:MFS family permease
MSQALDRMAASSPARPDWLLLGVLVTGLFMALLDVTIVNVAMPTIGRSLDASGAGLQLVVGGYIVSHAMLLITGARLGALHGHRNLYRAGLGTFTLASLACGLAPTTGALVGARVVQGAGAALMVPQILSVIQHRFAGPALARALGVYAAALASGAVVGQVLGGVLVSADLLGAGWRPVFLVNVPVGIAAALLVPRVVPADRVAGGRGLDLAGLATASTGVPLVVLPLVLGHERGWPAWTWGSLAAGVALLGVFARVERSVAARGRDPLLDPRVFRAPGMRAGLAAFAAGMAAYAGLLFALALHLQHGLGDSALRAGLTFAPAAAAFGATGYWWWRLPARLHHALVPAGFALTALAYLGLASDLPAGGHGRPWLTLALVAWGTGMGASFSPLLKQALVHVPSSEAADASGLLATTIQLSQVAGVAVFGGLFLSLAAHQPGHASATAFSTVMLWLAALTLLGVVPATLLARTVRRAATRRQPPRRSSTSRRRVSRNWA